MLSAKVFVPEIAQILANLKKIEAIIVPSVTFKRAWCSWEVVQASAGNESVTSRFSAQSLLELKQRVLEGSPLLSSPFKNMLSASEASNDGEGSELCKNLALLKSLDAAYKQPEKMIVQGNFFKNVARVFVLLTRARKHTHGNRI